MFTKRINKIKARNIFNAGKTIKIIPCKANPNSIWWSGDSHLFNKKGIEEFPNETFDSIVASFEYYNCNTETGKYAAFYMEEY